MKDVLHSFHIPVMGTGFTIDSPIKVAHYGISSVISIIDHKLIEQMRAYYCKESGRLYTPIGEHEDDARARRITAYLDLVKEIVDEKFSELHNSPFREGSEITRYFEMLDDSNPLKAIFRDLPNLDNRIQNLTMLRLRDRIKPGKIEVNIMTKLDGANTTKSGEKLPIEYNDAHAALRGFANSSLESSIVFSAGLNPRLYSYLSEFEDFYPDEDGYMKKKVILKVSDYRSALIQGKFLAKKGIWVSEFRIESGLNCGGHAFATDGYLLGPILEEFKTNREELRETLFGIYAKALEASERTVPSKPPRIKLTVQGGVGTSEEHHFLLDHYKVDSVGWGSPFLLVPEAVSIDSKSLDLIARAKEEDFYLSRVSPLGVPFNTVKGNSAEEEKMDRMAHGKPGAPCVKKHLATNTEFTEEPICVASLKYQKKKIDELIELNLNDEDYKLAFNKIIEKICLCVGLGNGILIEKDIDLDKGTQGVAICPGPNTAYFSKKASLEEMVGHIYGRLNLIDQTDRPNMFVKELQLYVEYLKGTIAEYYLDPSEKQSKYIAQFIRNLNDGVNYYEEHPETLGHEGGLELLKLELTALELDEVVDR